MPDPHNPQQFNRYAYVVNNPLKHTDSSGHAIDGYYPSYSDYAGFAFLGVAVAGAGYLAANPYSAQRAADSVAALATDLIESVPLNSGPAPVNHTGGPVVTIEPIATLSFPLGPAAQATLETYPVGAGLAPGDLRTTFPLATGQTLQLAGPMQAVRPWEVGEYGELKGKSDPHDGLQIHHVPQRHPAARVIPNYDPKTAPAIAVPTSVHQKILNPLNLTGTYRGTPSALVRQCLMNVKAAGAPAKAVKQLKQMIQKKYNLE